MTVNVGINHHKRIIDLNVFLRKFLETLASSVKSSLSSSGGFYIYVILTVPSVQHVLWVSFPRFVLYNRYKIWHCNNLHFGFSYIISHWIIIHNVVGKVIQIFALQFHFVFPMDFLHSSLPTCEITIIQINFVLFVEFLTPSLPTCEIFPLQFHFVILVEF